MAAGSASDIPDSKSDYCPCNRCTVARKQGRQEIIDLVRELHKPRQASVFTLCEGCESNYEDDFGYEHIIYVDYPCQTIKALEGEK